MDNKTFIKTCETLTEKIENLEFVNKFQAKKIATLEEENARLKRRENEEN